MPIEIEVNRAKKRVVLHALGDASDSDAREAVTRLRELAKQHEDFDFLGDGSNVDGWPLTPGAIRALAAQGPVFGPQCRRAYVLPSLVGYGLARMYAAFTESNPDRVRLFRARADAVEWLDSGDGAGPGT